MFLKQSGTAFDDDWKDGHSPFIGVDQETSKNYIFLCNPYETICMLNGLRKFNPTFANLSFFALQAGLFVFQYMQVKNHVLSTIEFTFELGQYPFFFFYGTVGKEHLFWVVESCLAMGGMAAVVATGIVTNLTQQPLFLRKWWVIIVNLKVWLFLFGEWLFLLAIGIIMFMSGSYTIRDEATAAFYKVTMATLVVGSFDL